MRLPLLLACAAVVSCNAPPDMLAGANLESAVVSRSDAVISPSESASLSAGGATGGAERATWSAPADWVEMPPASSMRLAQWQLPGSAEYGPAECALFSFPGGGGTVDANIARWLGQFEQPDGVPSAERAERMTMTVQGVPTTLLQVTGVFLAQDPPMTGPIDPRPDHALFAAIFETEGAPHFVKCTGPRQTIGDRAVELSTFVTSFRFGA